MNRRRLFISIISAMVAALAITVAASAGEYCPPKLPDPIDYPVSCADQGDAAVKAALSNPIYGFVNNGGVYASDVEAAQMQSFLELAQPTNPIIISGNANSQYVTGLAGFLRLAMCAAMPAPERTYVTCYADWPDSVMYVSGDQARAMLKSGTFRAPAASLSQVTKFPRGNHWLTCAGGSPTGRVVSTGNAGEVVPFNSVGLGLIKSNPLDYTIEVA